MADDPNDVYASAGTQYSVDPLLLQAVSQVESGGNDKAVSPQGARSRMQLMPATAASLGVRDLTDPTQTIPAGANYLAQGFAATGTPEDALRYYHGGPDRALWGPKGDAYVQKVAQTYQALKAQQPAPVDPLEKWGVTTAPAQDAAPSGDIFSRYGVGASPAPAYESVPAHLAPDGSGAMTNLSDADYAKFMAKPAVAPVAPVAQPATPAPVVAQAAPGIGAGLVRGARDMIDTPAQWLASGADKLGINSVLGTPTGADVAAGNANALQSYNAAQGGGWDIPRIAGNVAAVLPMAAATNGVLGAVPAVGPLLAGSATGNALTRIGSGVVNGAIQGAGIGAIAPNPDNVPLADRALEGAKLGGVLGGAIPATIGAARGLAGAVSGSSSSITPEAAQLGQLARDTYGIQLKAPQLGMNPTLKYINSALKVVPGSGAGAENAAVQGQFNRAVSRTFGEDADKITPDVLSSAQSRIGNGLEKIENSNKVSFDQPFLDRLAGIEQNARASLTDPEYAVIQRQMEGILKNLQPGDSIEGATYGNLIHKGSPLDSAAQNTNSNIANYAKQIKEALRDSLNRSLSPEDADAYRGLRTQYKNLKTVEPLTLRADTIGGAAPSTGDISPAALRARVNQQFGNVAQAAPGEVPLNDLARIGQFMKDAPSSGTSERGSYLYAGTKLAELAGAAALGNYAGLVPATVGLGAGIAIGRGVGAGIRSDWLANRMIANGLNGGSRVANPLAQIQPYIAPALMGNQNALTSTGNR